VRVLLTGFGPFPGAPVNPSAVLVKTLARRRRPALAGLVRTVHVFATSYAAVDRDLPKLFAEKPDIVLMFGLAGRTRQLRIELRARNAVSVLFPDADGRRPQHGVIAPGEPSARQGSAPVARLAGALRGSALPPRLSRDAGRYVCNYAYWRALQHAPHGRPLVQFVHVPAVRLAPQPRRRRRQRSRRGSPALAQLIRAGETLLIALVAARCR
jgi:pyroglutamyl-peptidase